MQEWSDVLSELTNSETIIPSCLGDEKENDPNYIREKALRLESSSSEHIKN